jgi:hypothetical protein
MSSREDLPIIKRVAARLSEEERVKVLLLKLRKGADASVSMRQLILVMGHLGGWTIEDFIGLVPQQEEGHHSADGSDNAATIRRIYQQLKSNEVKSLPANPTRGTHYVMDVKEPKTGYKPEYQYVEYLGWVGKDGIRFTSPEGKVFELLPNQYSNPSDPYKMSIYHVTDWLKRDTHFYRQVSDKLEMPTYEEEKGERKPRTRDNTGTCPCCFRNIKLKSRGGEEDYLMVLHGYRRPGWGSTVGRCWGVDFPPFELSPKGTQMLLKEHLEPALESAEKELRRCKAGEVDKLYNERSQKWITEETEGPGHWKHLLEVHEVNTENKVKYLKRDIESLEKLIRGWKKQPLPKEGDPIKDPPRFLM